MKHLLPLNEAAQRRVNPPDTRGHNEQSAAPPDATGVYVGGLPGWMYACVTYANGATDYGCLDGDSSGLDGGGSTIGSADYTNLGCGCGSDVTTIGAGCTTCLYNYSSSYDGSCGCDSGVGTNAMY